MDCATYVVLGSVGLDVGGESIPHVAGRIEDAIAAPAPADAMDGARQGNVTGCR